ncbi:urease accessory protein UreF [Methylobacterium sp. Leaf118]|uniref:urease accessory protein UreF n=1 Tax=Methylobacterium sp. Leaf118 TaxID=2876562 RepID=UPI001E32E2CA|nr:urease accessory UreF family protein [Methylobacterium sp. Leaf118]
MTTPIRMTTAAGRTGMIEALRLMAWLSPAYPVGGFAYSHGLEWAVETGAVADEAGLAAWLGDVLALGAGRNDLILTAHAHRAGGEGAALAAVNALALAMAPSRELHLETSQQGRSFLDATLAAWPCPALDAVGAALPGPVALPVAVGAAAAAHGTARAPTLAAYGLAFVQAIVSAALRCAPIGQGAGTRIVAALTPRVAALAEAVEPLGLDALGSATLRVDLGSFRHETQYSRIFRS